MRLSERHVHLLDRLAQVALWLGVGVLLVPIISWQITKVAIGGTALLNWAAGLGGVGVVGNCVANAIKMKRLERGT